MTPPTVVIEIEGGLINLVYADKPVRVIILDADTEGGDDENIVEVFDTEFYLHDHDPCEISETYVREVIAQLEERKP